MEQQILPNLLLAGSEILKFITKKGCVCSLFFVQIIPAVPGTLIESEAV